MTQDHRITDPEIGMVCYLRSGSPPMTITELCDDGTVRLAWFEAGEVDSVVLPIEVLKRA